MQQAVEAALAADQRLDAATIAVTVSHGFVELSGMVSSTDEVRRVLRRVGRVDGVRGIVNRLRVIGRPTLGATGPPPAPAHETG